MRDRLDWRRRADVLCIGLALGAGVVLPNGAWAEAPLIAWTADQARAAGVQTQVLQPTSSAAAAGMRLQGTVVLPPQATVVVSAPLAGVVQEVFVGVGQTVAAGAPLARLQSPQLMEWQRDAMQAQAQADLAQSKLRREEKLLAEGIVPLARVQETRSQQRIAQSMLAERQQALRMAGGDTRGLNPQLTLKSPSSATVMEVLAAPGSRLEAGASVVKLVRAGYLTIELQATAEQARRLHVGDALQVMGCNTPARLSAIAPQVNAGNQSVLLRADVRSAERCLRVNQFVDVQVTGQASAAPPSLRVPASAVVQQQGQPHVFVQRANGFAAVPVQLGPGGDAGLPVLGGLKAGDAVVVRGTAALKGAWQGLGVPPAAPASAAVAGK